MKSQYITYIKGNIWQLQDLADLPYKVIGIS